MTKVEIRRPQAHFSLALLLISSIVLMLTEAGCRTGAAQGEMTAMLEKRIDTFDPRRSTDTAAERMRQVIFNGLKRKNEKYEPVPNVAEKFESYSDCKTLIINLRPK